MSRPATSPQEFGQHSIGSISGSRTFETQDSEAYIKKLNSGIVSSMAEAEKQVWVYLHITHHSQPSSIEHMCIYLSIFFLFSCFNKWLLLFVSQCGIDEYLGAGWIFLHQIFCKWSLTSLNPYVNHSGLLISIPGVRSVLQSQGSVPDRWPLCHSVTCMYNLEMDKHFDTKPFVNGS